MRKLILGAILAGVIALGAMLPMTKTQPVYAAEVECSILNCDKATGENGEGVFYILSLLINILTFGVGAAATLGFIISGYQYFSARDNAGQIMKAKSRMLQIVIGLAIYALFWVIIEFLIPGGIV